MDNQQNQEKSPIVEKHDSSDKKANSRIIKKGRKLYKKFYKEQIGVLRLKHEMAKLESEISQYEVKRLQALSILASSRPKPDGVKEKNDSDSEQLKDER